MYRDHGGYARLAAHNNPQLVQVSCAEIPRQASPRRRRTGTPSISDSAAFIFRARIGKMHAESRRFSLRLSLPA
jgi:hypothetical protein